MNPDLIKQEAERRHDTECYHGDQCPSRYTHVEKDYVPIALREELKKAQDELVRARERLEDYERDGFIGIAEDSGPSIWYMGTDGTLYQLDSDVQEWPIGMTLREEAILRSLLKYSLDQVTAQG